MKKIALMVLLLCAAGIASAQHKNIKELNTSSFLEKISNYEMHPYMWKYEGSKPAIIEFYAPWCGYCKEMEAMLETAVEEYDGKILIYKVNIEGEPDLKEEFGIKSVPSVLFVPMVGKPTLLNGMVPQKELHKMIDNFLLKK